jgi:hypothetical protein
MLNNAQDHSLITEEIFSKKNHMADDGMLCKTLFFDIARQAHILAAIAFVDTSNCYNRNPHGMASLFFSGITGANICSGVNAWGDRKHEVLPLYRFWRFCIICRQWDQH